MVGESATPGDLVDRLVTSGAVFEGDDGNSRAMVLDHEPPRGPEHLEVRRIASVDDYRVSMRIALEDADPETWAATEAGLEAAWAEASRDDRMYSFLAFDDGEPVAFAQLVWLTCGLPYLGGATTLRA